MGKKLLVADDSVTIQKVIKLALSSEGYDIVAVSDGTAAVQAIENEMPDVVLIDVALPAVDAYAVKKAVNEKPHLSGVGFILMASAFERVDEQLSQEVTFHARLIKPFDPAHLRKAVAQVLEKSKVVRGPEHSSPVVTPSPRKETSRVLDTLTSSAPTPPPLPPMPQFSRSFDDLPPMSDMMPTLDENSKPAMTEEEFKLEISENVQSPASHMGDEIEEEITQTRTLENDIKDLTESTIKMSGLDDFEWSLDDTKKMRAPGPNLDHTRTLEMPQPTRGSAPTTDFTVLPRSIDDGGSNFLSMGVGASTEKKPRPTPTPTPAPAMGTGAQHTQPASLPAMNRAEMEQLIRREFELAIERIARDVVPQIAEQMIRKEIEKLLAEN